MAVNESVSMNKMTNFALPSPKRHRKYEEKGGIHDEVLFVIKLFFVLLCSRCNGQKNEDMHWKGPLFWKGARPLVTLLTFCQLVDLSDFATQL